LRLREIPPHNRERLRRIRLEKEVWERHGRGGELGGEDNVCGRGKGGRDFRIAMNGGKGSRRKKLL